MEIPESKLNNIQIKDEWDENEFKNVFDNNNRIILQGVYPGVGKTTAVEKYAKNKKALFICPNNRLVQKIISDGFDTITLNMLLGIYLNVEEYSSGKKYDVSEYDVIAFDEIFMYSTQKLKKIDNFMKCNPTKKFIGMGDLDQLLPFELPENIKDTKKYMAQCIDQIFPNQIILKVIKRQKSIEDQQKLINLKADLFDKKKPVIETLRKHGIKILEKATELTSERNICYFTFRADIINNWIHNKLVKKPNKTVILERMENGKKKKMETWPGLEVLCRKYYKKNGLRLFTNYIYKILSVNKMRIELIEEVENKKFTFKIGTFLNHFRLPYSMTCHSCQGQTIEQPMTIYDANVPHTSREFIWTAITRATDLKYISVWNHQDDEISGLLQSRKKLYYSQKIQNYKKQDKLVRREWKDEDYISPEWILEQWRALKTKTCPCCAVPFEQYVNEDGQVITNITVDRKDNKLAHIKTNCQLMCRTCNVTKK
jgi:hypothetical protein